MLILKRNHNEKVIITTPSGERIVVTVTHIIGSVSVKLGFSAPKEFEIHREEVQKKRDAEAAAV